MAAESNGQHVGTAPTRPSGWIFLLLTLGVFSAIPVAVLGHLVSAEGVEDASRRFDVRGRTLASDVVDSVEELLLVKAEVVGVIAGTVESTHDVSPVGLQHLLDAQYLASGSFDAVYISDASGRSLVIAPTRSAEGRRLRAGINYSDRDYFQQARQSGEASFSKVQEGRLSGVANVMIGVPYFRPTGASPSEVDFAGIVGAGVRLEIVEANAARLTGGSDDFRVVILDGENHVLVDTNNQLVPMGGASTDTVLGGDCVGTSHGGADETGARVRAVCAPLRLGEQAWSVWVLTPESALTADASHARRATFQAVLISLFVAFIVSLGVVVQVRRVFERLQEAVERVSRGDHGVQVAVPGRWAPRELVEFSEALRGSITRIQESETSTHAQLLQLQQANARQAPLAAVWDQLGDAIELLDPDGRVEFVNPAHEALFDERAEDVVGRLSSLFSGRDMAMDGRSMSLIEARQVLTERGKISTTFRRSRANTVVEFEVCVSPILDVNGELRQMAVVRRDLTSVRMSQQAAAHNERLAAVGTMAAGLAHEINNPLSYIKSSLELIIEDDTRPKPEFASALRLELATDALHGVERVASIVSSLLQLGRDGEVETQSVMVPVDLGDVVASAVELVEPKLRKHAQLLVELPGSLSTRARSSELVQIFVNLLINAGQAMPAGAVDQCFVRVTGGRSPDGRQVYVDVTDNGPGIPTAKLSRIFDPFYTTKGVGEGTGLGLSISNSIAKAHGGSLQVCSSPAEGTVFRLTLPWLEGHAELACPSDERLEQRPILIVDDDVLVGRSLARMLGRDQVHVVHNVEDAMRVVDQCPDFKVVVSDVKMAGRTGVDLFHYLRTHREILSHRMIFMTGGAGEGPLLQQLADTGRPMLTKPLSRAMFQRALAPFLNDSVDGADSLVG